MTEAELLDKVKTGLGFSGNYHDEILKIYINTAKSFMKNAGVPQSVIDSGEGASVGCILTGVNDLYNYSGGGVKFSPVFMQMVIQLATGNEGKADV
jgi:hypothetical protein